MSLQLVQHEPSGKISENSSWGRKSANDQSFLCNQAYTLTSRRNHKKDSPFSSLAKRDLWHFSLGKVSNDCWRTEQKLQHLSKKNKKHKVEMMFKDNYMCSLLEKMKWDYSIKVAEIIYIFLFSLYR